jgi:hypothetical protein
MLIFLCRGMVTGAIPERLKDSFPSLQPHSPLRNQESESQKPTCLPTTDSSASGQINLELPHWLVLLLTKKVIDQDQHQNLSGETVVAAATAAAA